MKIGILQHNIVVGDCAGNAAKITEGYKRLRDQGAELVVSSELGILGYPPRDLLESQAKLEEEADRFWSIVDQVNDVGLIVGTTSENSGDGKPLFNTAAFLHKSDVIAWRKKELLPTYDVFDESRYFEPGPNKPCIVRYRGKRVGIIVCEDAWSGTENPNGHKLYNIDPVAEIAERAPDILIIINASPYYWGKGDVRFDLVRRIAKEVGCPVIYVNQVGGNDELIFDGRSFAVDAEGQCIGVASAFQESEMIFDTDSRATVEYPSDTGNLEELRQALVLGVRDYLAKTGFKKVVIGLSGGIDSALVACIARDAVGAENVTGIAMPSSFSSEASVADARQLALNLFGVRFEVVNISKLYDTFGDAVNEMIGWKNPNEFGNDVTEENVQARLRGMVLMAYSNRTGALVLSTGNKSELAVGYCTLYGDMVGGLAVIADVPKTLVYQLARYYNYANGTELIPVSTIDKAPSAELRPDQKDQDSLPPYDVLDQILEWYVEEGKDIERLKYRGIPPEVIESIVQKVDRNEYKRKQAAPGLKVTTKAFGSGRRIPIATKPREVLAEVS